MDEDCLYLNVFSAHVKGSKLPVMVWIHGGGNIAGTAIYPPFGFPLAARASSGPLEAVEAR